LTHSTAKKYNTLTYNSLFQAYANARGVSSANGVLLLMISLHSSLLREEDGGGSFQYLHLTMMLMPVGSKESSNRGYANAVLRPMVGNYLDRSLIGASPQHTTVLLQQKANKLVRTNKCMTPCTTNKVVLMGKEAMVLHD
jgi:hypothetical protein